METYEQERWVAALNRIWDVSRGTLWIIKDVLWKECLPDFEVKRKGHPGLSLGRDNRKFVSFQDTVPMLIGTSKDKIDGCGKGFKVCDVFGDRVGAKRVTYFSVVRPCALTEFRPCANIPIEDFLGKTPRVEVNPHKPHLTDSETLELDKYLWNHGVDLSR